MSTPGRMGRDAPDSLRDDGSVCKCGHRADDHDDEWADEAGGSMGNASGATVANFDRTETMSEALTDWRMFLDAAEKYANQAREMREAFNDPTMGEISSTYAERFYELARIARVQPPPAPAGVAADADQDRSDVWRTLGLPQDADADAAIAAIVALRRERDEARYCAVLETQRLDWLASRGFVAIRCHGEGLFSIDTDNRSQVRSATGLREAIDAAMADTGARE